MQFQNNFSNNNNFDFHSKRGINEYLDEILPPKVAEEFLKKIQKIPHATKCRDTLFELERLEKDKTFQSSYYNGDATRTWALAAYALRTGNTIVFQRIMQVRRGDPSFLTGVTLEKENMVLGCYSNAQASLLDIADQTAINAYKSKTISNKRCLSYRNNLIYLNQQMTKNPHQNLSVHETALLLSNSDIVLQSERPLLYAEILAEQNIYRLDQNISVTLNNDQLDYLNKKLINFNKKKGKNIAKALLDSLASTYLKSHKMMRHTFKKALLLRAMQTGDLNMCALHLEIGDKHNEKQRDALYHAAFNFTLQRILNPQQYPVKSVETDFQIIALLKKTREVPAYFTGCELLLSEAVLNHRKHELTKKLVPARFIKSYTQDYSRE